MEKDKPRMIEHWEVKHSIFLGGHEILFAEDKRNTTDPYFVGDCSYNNPFGVAEYSNCIGTTDYLEAVSEYTQRIQTQIKLVRQERADRGMGDESLSTEHCLPGGLGENIAGKLVIIKPGIMHRDRRTADYQYFYADGGNGCRAESIGCAVFGQNLFTGKRARWERADILGIADLAKLPEWAKDRLKSLQTEKQADNHPKKKTDIER